MVILTMQIWMDERKEVCNLFIDVINRSEKLKSISDRHEWKILHIISHFMYMYVDQFVVICHTVI